MLLTVLLSALGTNLIALVLVDKLLPQGQRMMRPLDLDWAVWKKLCCILACPSPGGILPAIAWTLSGGQNGSSPNTWYPHALYVTMSALVSAHTPRTLRTLLPRL